MREHFGEYYDGQGHCHAVAERHRGRRLAIEAARREREPEPLDPDEPLGSDELVPGTSYRMTYQGDPPKTVRFMGWTDGETAHVMHADVPAFYDYDIWDVEFFPLGGGKAAGR